MPDETDLLEIEEQTLIVPGVLCVSPTASGANKKRIRIGPSAGWHLPRGIMKWEREISFVRRSDATADFLSALRGTLPHEQIAPKKYAMAARAAMASPLIPLSTGLVADARGQGVRVYTVGVDRVSAGFYYFAEGGAAEPVRWQGNLVEMLAPGLKANATNAEIEALLEGLIERLLFTFSDGSFSELDVELADALPRLSRDGTGLQGTDLDAFDASARRLALQSAPWEGPARKIAEAVAATGSASGDTLRVPLYGQARRDVRAALDVHFGAKTLRLADQPLWFVTGQPKEEEAPAPTPAPKPVVIATATPAVSGASSTAKPGASPTATLTGVAAPVTGPISAPMPAVVPAPASAAVSAAARTAAAPAAAAPAAAAPAARISPATPAVAITPSPALEAPVPAPVAPALEAPASALAPAPATLAGPASELPASEAAAPEPPAPAPEAAPAAASTEAPAAAPVVEPPPAEAAASGEPETSEAIVPAGDERVVPAARDPKALAKRRPFPYSTLLLVFALVYFVLRRLHVIP
jgi:hypothetical protein